MCFENTFILIIKCSLKIKAKQNEDRGRQAKFHSKLRDCDTVSYKKYLFGHLADQIHMSQVCLAFIHSSEAF